MTVQKALFSSATPEHGTPPEIVEAARKVLGCIDLDPASSAVFNEAVKAEWFFTKEDDGLAQEWSGMVYLNPPGDKTGELVKRFWTKLVTSCLAGQVQGAIYAGFSIDQLQTLQNSEYGGPLGNRFPICIPKQRPKWIRSLEASPQPDMFLPDPEPTPVVGNNPTKPSFFCYVPGQGNAAAARAFLFRSKFAKFGEVR